MQLPPNPGFFHRFIERQRAAGRLVCQPRMGFSSRLKMRRGLKAVRDCAAPTIGTITLDSFTRTNDLESARRAIEEGRELNGYPIVTHGIQRNRELIDGLLGDEFPIQVRHGTALPLEVFRALIAAGLTATEGGPISYCLPYSRTPLADCIEAWGACCRMLAALESDDTVPHLESFGGCMLGQLCPPAVLVAVSLLEAMFFRLHGIASVSLSYAQNTNFEQDVGAILALRRLAEELLGDISWHVVVYSFMGKFPETPAGAQRLIEESAELAALTGSERLIVKTAAEAHQIPSIDDNVRALEWAWAASQVASERDLDQRRIDWHRRVITGQARFLVQLVLDLDPDLPRAITRAFADGLLDIAYCLHPDNPNRVRSWIDHEGTIHWADPGGIPFPRSLRDTIFRGRRAVSSMEFATMLTYNQRKYDSFSTPPRRAALAAVP